MGEGHDILNLSIEAKRLSKKKVQREMEFIAGCFEDAKEAFNDFCYAYLGEKGYPIMANLSLDLAEIKAEIETMLNEQCFLLDAEIARELKAGGQPVLPKIQDNE